MADNEFRHIEISNSKKSLTDDRSSVGLGPTYIYPFRKSWRVLRCPFFNYNYRRPTPLQGLRYKDSTVQGLFLIGSGNNPVLS